MGTKIEKSPRNACAVADSNLDSNLDRPSLSQCNGLVGIQRKKIQKSCIEVSEGHKFILPSALFLIQSISSNVTDEKER